MQRAHPNRSFVSVTLRKSTHLRLTALNCDYGRRLWTVLKTNGKIHGSLRRFKTRYFICVIHEPHSFGNFSNGPRMCVQTSRDSTKYEMNFFIQTISRTVPVVMTKTSGLKTKHVIASNTVCGKTIHSVQSVL